MDLYKIIIIVIIIPRTWDSIPGMEKDFSLLRSAQNGSGANTRMGAGENFTR
jgi:hypothetical protein